MNIIFGRESAEALQDKYTMLELDTFRLPNDQEITAFCAVETIPLLDMPRVHSMKTLHADLLQNFRKGDWNYCEQALEHLVGFWNQELDTFYDDIKSRIAQQKHKELTEQWWIIRRDFVNTDQHNN